ncbi:MAG TPA: hypothetical protein VGM87_04230 [Roseomonas sp.]
MTQAALAAAFLLGLSAAAQAQIAITGGAGAVAGGISGAISTVSVGGGGVGGNSGIGMNAAEARISGGTSVAITLNNGVTISTSHDLTMTGLTQGNNVAVDITGISGSFQFEGFGVSANFLPF